MAPARADLRLLLPAAAGWVVQALLLGASGGWRVTTAGLAGVATAGALARHRRRGAGRVTRPPGGGEPTSYSALLALTGLVVVLLTGALAAWTAVRDAGPVAELAQDRAVVTVTAGVASDPHLVAGGHGGQPLVAVVLDVREVTGRGRTTAVQDPVLVLGDPSLLALPWRAQVRLTGRLGPTDDPADDVVAMLAPRGPVTVVSAPGLLERTAALVRGRFASATEHLPADARGLLPGLVLGDTSRAPQDLTTAMQASGLTHLSAVSGSNVTIVLAAGIWACGWLGVRRRRRPLVALALLLGFVVLVRPEPSVLRAAAMGCVGLLGLGTHRRREGLPAVAAAVVGLLVWDPWLSRSVGFALSTLATIGLLVLARPWGEALAARLPPRLRWLGPAVALPLAAQVVCGPVVVVLQGSVSLVAVLTNLVVSPLVTPATVLGVAVALLALVVPPLAAWAAWLPALPTLGIAAVARAGAGLPWGSVPWPSGAGGALSLAALSLVVVLTGPWLLHHGRRRPAVVAACALLGLAAGAPTARLTWPPPGWRYVMCDVGQGDGMVLRSAAGTVVVVDTGPDPAAVDGCLGRLGVTRVDAVVLTHDHADHVDGLPGVLRGRSVGALLVDPSTNPPTARATWWPRPVPRGSR
ncbi:ComEC/Rec2 family competence protein [Lapillicoccus jejuensis]|uniref:Competence protein ComEC n=1 Tax=Lapillicoccus jejuensis TaxID=402171 RepID=A0A542DVC5_9MICO|nr:competence protein ComEC [Lapillicoccus jejuensis]